MKPDLTKQTGTEAFCSMRCERLRDTIKKQRQLAALGYTGAEGEERAKRDEELLKRGH